MWPLFYLSRKVAALNFQPASRSQRKKKGHFEVITAASAMEAYEQVQKGPLKLKGVAELGVTKRKKKKDKDKDKAKILEAMGTSKKSEEEEKRRCLDKRTPAQAAFEKMQEKRQMERILKKASKTHKQRVEDFNRHLDTLTEHYDIPKVSWTK
jgi:protein FAM32A